MAEQKNEAVKEAKSRNVFARIVEFIRQVISELGKVHWPTRTEIWTYFWVVIFFVIALMIPIGIFDYAFAFVTKVVFG